MSLLSFKKGKEIKNYRLVCLTLVLGKVVEQTNLEAVSRHMKVKKAIRSIHHRFITLDQPASLL